VKWKWVAVGATLLVVSLVVPLVLATTGSDHARGTSARVISRDWASLRTDGNTHLPVGKRLGFAPRSLLRIPTRSGYAAELWVAPTRNGNFCAMVRFKGSSGGGCIVRAAGLIAPATFAPGSISRSCVLRGPYLVQASVTAASAAAAEIVYADGTSTRLPLVRVTSPIDASFFLYELPRDRLTHDTGVRFLRALDTRGRQVARSPVWPGLVGPSGCTSLS